MVAAVVIVAVLGFCLPAVAFLVVRSRMSRPDKNLGYDEVDRWLLSEFQMGWRERSRVRKAVLKGEDVEQELEGPARELAARVLADRFRGLRLTRRIGWVQMAISVAFAVSAIAIFVRHRSDLETLAAIFALNAVVSAVAGPWNTFVRPRRIRRNAQRLIEHNGMA